MFRSYCSRRKIKLVHRSLLYQVRRLTDSEIRFGGNPHELVERFVISIQEYKCHYNITDAIALDDFKEILYGHALDWWKNNKTSNWQEALNGLIAKYKQN